jgi:hypothetical protein
MQRARVISTNIASIGYDMPTTTFEIEFKAGGIYQYYGVSIGVYNALMGAPSKGTYFATNIKPNYRCLKVG